MVKCFVHPGHRISNGRISLGRIIKCQVSTKLGHLSTKSEGLSTKLTDLQEAQRNSLLNELPSALGVQKNWPSCCNAIPVMCVTTICAH